MPKDKNKFPRLNKDINVDFAIIGGGITGLLNAYFLSKEGKKVALIEKKTLASNATGLTTAFITEVIDTNLKQIISLFGKDIAKTVWQSSHIAIDQLENLIKKEKIDCGFVRCSNFLYASEKKQFKGIKEEYETYKKMGFKARLDANGMNLNFPNFGYMEVFDQAKFNIYDFIYSLSEIVTKQGVQIFEQTEAEDIVGENPVKIITPMADIITEDVLIATYQPFTSKKTHLKKGMYRTYVFEVEIPKNFIKEAMYEDSSNPYYYFRIDPDGKTDSMIVGGEDHKDIFGSTLKNKSFKALEKYLKELMGEEKYKIKNKWDGPILEPSDGLPLIGEIKPHYYVATAFSGNGMTYSTISALLIRDLILGKENSWKKAYDPKRALLHPKRLAVKAKDYVEEFVNGALKNMFKT